MVSRERVKNVLTFKEVDRLPRQLWNLPGVEMFRKVELDEVRRKYPSDFESPNYTYGAGKRCNGVPNMPGSFTDAWGCTRDVGEPGVTGEVKHSILSDWAALDTYQPPWELIEEADLSKVNRFCSQTDKFVLVGTETRPFERMQFLRGTENLYMDLAYGESEVFRLRDMLHEFFLKEMEMWAATDVDGVSFMDDWGSQKTLLISPVLWRQIYKPLYKDYCDILHSKGKFVFFHSDGNIEHIYPDLIEIGVDAVNSQLFCMNMEEIGEKYSGKIAFWGEIDRQNILPFGNPETVHSAVKRAASALLKHGRTGVIAQCEWGVKDPVENISAVFEAWNQY